MGNKSSTLSSISSSSGKSPHTVYDTFDDALAGFLRNETAVALWKVALPLEHVAWPPASGVRCLLLGFTSRRGGTVRIDPGIPDLAYDLVLPPGDEFVCALYGTHPLPLSSKNPVYMDHARAEDVTAVYALVPDDPIWATWRCKDMICLDNIIQHIPTLDAIDITLVDALYT